ncbi:MAG: transketolase [Candidatus Pelagibacterales bacterium]|nr:MAG: transketolase [Pelagibacterales bacterium]
MSPVFKDLANAIRFLSIDAVQKANSGHPGLPMGMADVATVLFKYYLRFNPKNPEWINRDRFILSAGHGSMLLYSLLYLTGYKSISINDIKSFRQLNSICAGHPEYEKNTGIETTTGPLGQGLSNAVGMAIAEEILAKKFGANLINHKTYVIASDGDFMEGISHESMSLAGHLKLKNLVVFFDNNKISIDGPTNLSVSDNYRKRFESYGWSFQEINGHDEKQISKAIKKSLNSKKPNIISCKTIIGYGSPNKAGKSSSHGAALGESEVELVRKKLKWKYKAFEIPKEILQEWRKIGEKGMLQEKKWNQNYNRKSKKIKDEFFRITNDKLPNNFDQIIQQQKKKIFDLKSNMASRKSSAFVLEEITNSLTELIGGSADLSGSNNTNTKHSVVIKPKNFKGNYIHYGVREHAMAGIMNGMALHKGIIPYGGTFLVFLDYCKPSLRLSALMGLKVIYIFSHDSIGLGEDGPTHQPIEHLVHLRAIPNLNVFRPADTIETLECWELALKNSNTPSVIALSRQKLPFITETLMNKNMCGLGAYEIKKSNNNPEITLIASGSEVHIAIEAFEKLKDLGINSKVVSMPCQELFNKQSKEYKEKIIEKNSFKISIEASSIQGWEKYVGPEGASLGMKSFGKSAPIKDLYEYFNLTSDNVVKLAQKMLGK